MNNVEMESINMETSEEIIESTSDSFNEGPSLELEEQTESVKAAFNFLDELLERMRADIDIKLLERDGLPLLSLKGEDEGMLIGRHGETLRALQSLVKTMLQRHHREEENFDIIVDVDNYLERRRENLEQMALKLAEKAIYKSKPVHAKPMTAQDRRVMHMVLQDHPGVSTRSSGDGEERCVVIVPNRN